MTTKTIPIIPTEKILQIKNRTEVINSIHQERSRQEIEHPEQQELHIQFVALCEEIGEVAQALQVYYKIPGTKSTDKQNLYTELVQVAAVATRMAERVIKDEKQDL